MIRLFSLRNRLHHTLLFALITVWSMACCNGSKGERNATSFGKLDSFIPVLDCRLQSYDDELKKIKAGVGHND